MQQVSGQGRQASRAVETARRRPAGLHTAHQEPARSGPRARRRRRLVPAALLAAATAAVAFVIAAPAGRWMADAVAAWLPWTSTEEVLVAAGFGLSEITVAGQRFTSDSDVYDCLNLNAARTMPALDGARAKSCIEALPWVASVTLTRVYPSRLAVTITERPAFAVWQATDQPTGKAMLVDATGRSLSPTGDDDNPHLPRIAGPGAPEAAAQLFDTLRHLPDVANRLQRATRVTGRRWSLVLTGNLTIELPADGEATALSDLIRHPRGAELLAARDHVIDLRSRFEIAARPATGG